MNVRRLTGHRARPRGSEIAPIAERLGYLRATRLGFGLVVLSVCTVAPRLRRVSLGELVIVTTVYVLALAAPDYSARLRRASLIPVIGGGLLLDGVYLAWVMYVTGGNESPLRFLIYIHVIAVCLLGSYRSGLKIAAWHSILFFVVAYAQSGGILEVTEPFPSTLPGGSSFGLATALIIGALWAVTLGTATFSAVNERELRRQKIDLEELSALVAEIDKRADASDIPRILLNKLCEVFQFARGVVLASPGDTLSVLAYTGPGQPSVVDEGLDPIMEEAWDHHRTMLVRTADPAVTPRLATLLPDGRNMLIVPLFLDRGLRLGLLILEQPERDRISGWTVAIVEQFASHAALSLHNAWLVQELEDRLVENEALRTELLVQNQVLEVKVEERTQELSLSLSDLRVAHEQRKRLLARLVNAEEGERRRVADDIHDGPVQEIVVAGLLLDKLRKSVGNLEDLRTIDTIARAVATSVEGLRGLLSELRPAVLDQEGLEPALAQYLERFDGELAFRVDNRLVEEPTPEERITIYRIAQEALANVRKHAGAENVSVLLKPQDSGCLVRIQDDGNGFSPPEVALSAPGHLGISSMRERAEMAGGWCKVLSLPGAGTTVEFWIPEQTPAVNEAQDPEGGRSASPSTSQSSEAVASS